MTKNLPVKSGRKDVVVRPKPLPKKQVRHKRKVKTRQGRKEVVVNPDNVRQVVFRPKPLVQQTTSFGSGIRFPAKKLTPKVDWKQIIIKDAGKLSFAKKLEQEMKVKDIKLGPNEKIATKVLGVSESTIAEGLFDLDILDDKGKKQSVPFKLIGSPQSKKFMKYLNDAVDSGQKLIFSADVDDPWSDVPTNVVGPDGVMAILSGVKDINYVRDFKSTSQKFPSKPKNPSISGRRVNPRTGEITFYEMDSITKKATGKTRKFRTEQDFMKIWMATGQGDKDLYGNPWDPQTTIKEFATSEESSFKPDKDTVVIEHPTRVWSTLKLKNFDLREAVIWKLPDNMPKNHSFAVMLTNNLDNEIKELGKFFSTVEKAKAYIKEVDRTYKGDG